MHYVSICSGVGSEHLAWEPLGWTCRFFSEIDPFPSALLAYRFPDTPNVGDFTKVNPDEWKTPTVELVVGGTPCQSYSIAGKREGMVDERGSLALSHVRLARSLGARWIVWENVPGVFSTNAGGDFSRFLEELLACGYGFAYRILDSRFFGVAQRRRRVFLVGHLGDWKPAAAVLFEPQGMLWNTPTSEDPRERTTSSSRSRLVGDSRTREDSGREDASDSTPGSLEQEEPVVMAHGQASACIATGVSPTLTCLHEAPIVFRSPNGTRPMCFEPGSIAREAGPTDLRENAPTLRSSMGDNKPAVLMGDRPENYVVRRLTPVECERLQGMPDNWTQIPWRGKDLSECPDSRRYKAIGNGFTVPVVAWIGKRIQLVQDILDGRS